LNGARGPIATARLDLVPASLETLAAALAGNEVLAAALGARVPPTWPPEFLDRPALEFVTVRLAQHPEEAEWWMHFVVSREIAGEPRALIGSGGFAGPPAPDGSVEIGYGIVADRQRRGYATEAARGLIARAFDVPRVTHVVAHTMPELAGSIGVLERCGFRCVGAGAEPGTVRYRLDRTEFGRRD
jgi:[ribosomal protein S5]-alanine N-acetyltransferase